MDILQEVEDLRSKALERRDYRRVAKKAGLTYHWLQKFAIGTIPNPQVDKIAKLQRYFNEYPEWD